MCLGPGHAEAELLAELTRPSPGFCVPWLCVVVMQGRPPDDRMRYTGPVSVLGELSQCSVVRLNVSGAGVFFLASQCPSCL